MRPRGEISTRQSRLCGCRICAIDEALSDALAHHSRRYLSAVGGLLGQRLEYLYKQHQQALEAGADPESSWADTREQYRREAQGLLLAEIEARLLPSLGLIEALNEEIKDED